MRATIVCLDRIMWLLGLVAMVIGVLLYALCRVKKPWFLVWLDVDVSIGFCDSVAFQFLPSGIHAFAFTCWLAAAIGSSRSSLAWSGAFWFSMNVAWERACIPTPDPLIGRVARRRGQI